MEVRTSFFILCLVFLYFTDTTRGWWLSRRRRRRCSPTNCQVTGWSSWGTCSFSCGSAGVQSRHRSVTRIHSCGGSCYHLSEARACNRKCCPVNCAWNWGNWGACQGCGTGSRSRTVVVLRNPSCGGTTCPNSRSQSQACNTGRCCPVNCAVSSWGSWGSCNAQCEKMGVRSRTRTVVTAVSCNGTPCPGLTQYNTCNGPCCLRNCVLSDWTVWGTCSAPAGQCSTNSGTHARSRTVVRAQSCGGTCSALQESKACTPVPIQCQVSQWSSWSTCTLKSGSCGAGTQARTRTIVRQPYCASACPATTDRRDCVHSCCPVDCTLSQWTAWGKCSANCGQGSQVRTRQVATPASCGGACSSVLSQAQQCTVVQKIDCQLGPWSSWSTCSSGCGNGLQQRARSITRQPTACGLPCGNLTETRQCQSYRENRDCQVSSWAAWAQCSSNCSYGTQVRLRNVIQTKRCNGASCPPLQQSKTCGLPNGGCGQLCREADASCYCLPGYKLRNGTHCDKKDCGRPVADYCPPGEANGTVCRPPWFTCPNGASVFQTTCTVGCPSTYRLKGLASVSCEADGDWSAGHKTTYCRRINDPPSDIVLSGRHVVLENSPPGTLIGLLSSVDVNSKDNHTYVLVSDGFLQGKFFIIGNQLLARTPFDYETDATSYSIGITSTDNGNPPLSFTKYITVNVADVNEPPSDILISSTQIAENSDAGSVVGVLDTLDADVGQRNVYKLVDSANGMFRVQNNTLEVARSNGNCLASGSPKCPLNYESTKQYQIEVESADDRTPSFNITRMFNITVTNRNDPPYDIRISKNTVKENDPHGTVVGQLIASDEDAGQAGSMRFALVNDDGGKFALTSNGSVVKSKDIDYETDKSHVIEVRATDNGSPPASNTQKLTIIVIDINEPPVNITISPLKPSVPENSPVGTVVGTFEAYDSDFTTGLNLILDDNAGGRFKIADRQTCKNVSLDDAKTVCSADLIVSGSLNFEQSKSHKVTMRAEDRGHFIHRTFSIVVEDTNDPPSELLINGKGYEDVRENSPGAVVGKLFAVDEDHNQTHQFSLIENNDGAFVLEDDMLKLASNFSFDYENKRLYTVTVNVTDDGIPAASVQLKVDLRVTNVNEEPTDIQLSGSFVDENSPEETAVANITVTDPDDALLAVPRSYHSCRLLDSAGGRFKVVNQLYLAVGSGELNFERHSVHMITIECSDGKLSVSKSFPININDINEPPSVIRLSRNKVPENAQNNKLIGTFSTIDPDNLVSERQTFIYSVPSNDSRFQITTNQLFSTIPFDFETDPVLIVQVMATDNGDPALTKAQNFRIEVTDENDAPKDISISSDTVPENCAENTVVGALTTSDEDLNQRFTYSLADSADGRFKIEGDSVKVAVSNAECLKYGKTFCRLNFEEQASHTIQVTTIDNGMPSLSFTKNITIFLRNVNDKPRDIRLSNYTVPETAPVSYVIGRFTASDEDKGQILNCLLVENDGGRFGVDSNCYLYKATNETNFETNKTHSITVTMRDNGSPPLEIVASFQIEVLDVNEAPIKSTIKNDGGELKFPDDNPEVEENSSIGTVIGTIFSYDSEPVENLRFVLDDNGAGTFSLDKNILCSNTTGMVGARSMCSIKLLLNKNVNFEVQSVYNIIIRTIDMEGLFHVQQFTVKVVDKNDAPTGILIGGLSYAIVPENQPGTMVDEMTTIDEDRSQTHTYTVYGNNSQMYAIYKTYLFLSRGNGFNYEDKSSHMITLGTVDSGQPPMSFNGTFELRVQDVNEAPTDIVLDKATVDENSPVGTGIGNISVSDPDNEGARGAWQSHSCAIASGASGFLTIAGMQLVVAHNGIDYEKTSYMNISIRCEDSGSPKQFLEKSLVIQVQDVNEKPSNILLSSNVIPENTPPGGIAMLSTIDPDNTNPESSDVQSFTYSITNSDSDLPFEISGNILQTSRSLDYENQTSWMLKIRSVDDGTPPLFVDQDFVINITDVNEQPYDIILDQSIVDENCPLGTVVGSLSSHDPDNGQSFTYSLVDNAGGLFRIHNNQLKVAVDNRNCLAYGGNFCRINFEKQQSVDIRVKTEDNGTPNLGFEKTLTFSIRDINDRPRDIQLSANYLPENATKGFQIGSLTANDEDGQNITFRLTNDDNGRFALSGDGFVVKAKDTNYENAKTHKITVEASDHGNPVLTISKDFVIVVQDVNEAPTKIEITSDRGQISFPKNLPRVNENTAVGTIVGTLHAYDEDAVESLRFSLDDDGNGTFSVDNTASCSNSSDSEKTLHTVCTALIKVAGAINYEEDSTKTIIVRVEDNKGLHHSQLFSVVVRDQNDRPSDIWLNGLHTGYVNENEDNQLIATFETIDEDIGQSYSYRILNDGSVPFVISGGKLYTAPHASLNYEAKNSYTIGIESTDNGNPPMSYQRNLTVKVLDINEAPTSLSLSSLSVNENSPVGTLVGNISVNDPDNEGKFSGRQKAMCRVIVDTSASFEVKDGVKLVVKRATLNYERKASYSMRLRCDDNGIPSKSIEKDVTVRILDVNEAPTSIILSAGSVAENVGPVTIGRLVVTDEDTTPQTFTFAIMNRGVPLKIIGNSLQTTRPLNYEQQNVYTISVKAIDQGSLSVVENFTIHVQDRNDRPSSVLFTGSLTLEENSAPGVLVATASAVDEDFYQTHTYSITGIVGYGAQTVMQLPGYFTIESSSGRISSVSSTIDYEEFKAINISVLATDNGIPPLSISSTVTIRVRDVNHPPTDIILSGRQMVVENSPQNTVVGNLTVVDPDNKFGPKQTFSCVLNRTANTDIPFTIANKIMLIVSGAVNYERQQTFSLQVTCKEDHVNPYNITKTFIINVQNINERPTFNISSKTVPENQHPGAFVGTIVAIDPDNELTYVDNVTIDLLPGLDSAAFRLVGGASLITNQRFDYETKSRFSVKIRATDNGSPPLSTEQILDITIQDVNDRPQDITLSSTIVAENSPSGTIVGTLSTVDEDAGQTHIFNLINNIDNLAIHGMHLIVAGKLDFETEASISIMINATDSGNPALSFQKSFNITITDSNDAPSDIVVTLYPVPENNTADRAVANLKVIDEDRDHRVRSCSVVNNPGFFFFRSGASTDTVDMWIRGSATLDFETAPVINATVQCFDNGSPALSVQKQISIAVIDSNDKPTEILINGGSRVLLPENSPPEAVVGQLTCVDQDKSQKHSYTMYSKDDVFMINENSVLLRVRNASRLDYEALPASKTIPITIKVTDNGQPSLSLSADIQVEITDVNEFPSNIRMVNLVGNEVPENTTVGTHIGELFADNPEGFKQLLTFSALNWRDTFQVVETHGPAKVSYLALKKELDFDTVQNYNLSLNVSDNGVPPLSAQGMVVIKVKRSDPCFTGTLDCGEELCQRINSTHGNCGCLRGYEPKMGTCQQIDDCKAGCQFCDDPDKACKSKATCLPCSNNGTCVDKLMSFRCVCQPGFTDDRCKTNIDDCAGAPCQHGTCFDLVNNYRCECDDGYEGRNCEIDINECNRKECVKGDCSDLVAGFSCSCSEGIWGLVCNRLEKDCNPNPCGNNVCVPPGYADVKSLDKGGQKVLCATENQVVTLSFPSTSVPENTLLQNKWKYTFRSFITKLVDIPYYAVDLDEDLSNGGFFKATDVVMYPLKSSKTKRNVLSESKHVLFPLAIRVKDNLVAQDSFLRAVNKTCSRLQKSSIYWVYCDASYQRIKELGITAETGKSSKDKEGDVGGFKILKGNNIYILIGGGAGLLMMVAFVLIARIRKRNARRNAAAEATQFPGDVGVNYYDAMERHIAKRCDTDVAMVNPMYGEDENEVNNHSKMFSNPLYGATNLTHDEDDNTETSEDPGLTNPLYSQVQWYGDEVRSNKVPSDSDC
ncbi:protocadherin Fat 4-like isoform X4 [Rhopilema esculentum]|uniref:protocadherin Fat 4-like isoform X4 n=1 Tax=Rhopilema esculentum TaxID=499914 RepID=UPI0031DB3B25